MGGWGKANPKDITIEDLEEAEARYDAELDGELSTESGDKKPETEEQSESK
jgi:hypothetical protein